MQPVPANYPIAELTGPYLIGVLLNWGLIGTLTVQLYLYYLAFPNDRRIVKYLVYGLYVIEIVQTILIAHDSFALFGYGFGDLEALAKLNFSWLTVPIMSGIVACVGQVFYAYRIFILSKSRNIPIFIFCISSISSVAAIVTGVFTFQIGNVVQLNNRRMSIAAGIWCGGAALCDIIIAVCMTYYASSISLSLTRSTAHFRRTQMLVTKVTRLTIETGSVTAVAALLTFILFIALPGRNSYMALCLIVPKLYANTVYMVLNSRFQIVGGRDTYMSSTDHMSVPTSMIRDTTSQSAEGTRPADGRKGQMPVVVLSSEEFVNTSYEMGQMKDKPQGSCTSLPA
ncbi:hypothetical protein ARMGADRAFT_1086173 [Armillaria gallica]|uniref:DUF6534 domain-containing protein n=1 Tax=Armillaria gallica TaxID=47427 RepID=A0A2H3CZY7_ARMGA|nr:hypothetical protein ARMGADRAFT_1086173 [Armillaria gallica]